MPLDAKIRITAIVDQAVKALRQVEDAGKGARQAATATGGQAPLADVTKNAAEAAEAARQLREQLEAAVAGQKAVGDAAGAAGGKVKQQVTDQKKAADDALKAQKAAANQARMLGPQITDIFVGLTTGQSPLMVLLQQGGQLKDMFGGVGNAARALMSIFTPMRLLVGGIAAAIGTIAYEALAARQADDQLNKALALTGNTAATSSGQITQQAKALAAQQNAAVGDVRETLVALASSGQYTSTTLTSAGKAATALAKLTGQSSVETIKQFDGMGDGVARWAQKANQSYNFLTVEQFRYIQSLESQGRTQDAMKVALDALSSTMEQRAAPAVGLLERAWAKLKGIISGTLEDIRAIGRDDTAETRLASLSQKLVDLDAKRAKLDGKQDRTSQLELANTDADRARLASAVAVADAEVAANNRAKGKIAAQERQAQLDILHESKGFQDALSAVTESGVQKVLGQQLAALDRRQAAVELTNAKGLLSERDYNVQLNTIEQQRLQAQAAAVARQIEIAGGRKTESETDALANQAQVTALQGQLAQIQGQIAAAASKGRAIVEADTLATSRQRATEWGEIWQRADDQIRQLALQNGTSQAAAIADPVARASAEAAGKVADLRKSANELQRDLELRISLTVDPSARGVLEQQLAELKQQSKAAIDELGRSTTFQSLSASFADLAQSVSLIEQRMDTLAEQGAITVEEAERRKFAARAAALPQLEEIRRAMEAASATQADRNVLADTSNQLLKLKDTTTDFQKSLKSAGSDAFASNLTAIGSGAKTAKDGLLDMVGSFAKSWSELLNKRLGDAFFQQLSDAATKFASQNSGGWLGSLLSMFGLGSSTSFGSSGSSAVSGSGVGAYYAHTGAVIGQSGGWRQSVSPALFSFAPRYHTGGIAGLKPNEVPAILQAGEEVLTRDDPRHVANGGGRSIGNLQINTSISGAQGDESDQSDAIADLHARMTSVCEEWASGQRRQGGLFAGL